MYSQTITIFNRREGNEGDTWFPTILKNVHLEMDRAAILAKYGAESSDTAVLHVPFATDKAGNIFVGKKRWLSPKEWKTQLDHSQSVTFTPGDRFDFFWLGDWGNTDPVYDADHVADMDFYTYMNRIHDYVFAVSSVGGPYRLIPHFEIMGK